MSSTGEVRVEPPAGRARLQLVDSARLPGGVYCTERIGCIEEHLDWMRRCGRSDRTLYARRSTLTRLAEFLGHDPATATSDELEAWQRSLPSLNAIRHQTALVRPYHRWLVDRRHRGDDPAVLLLPTPRRRRRLPRPIPEHVLMAAVVSDARPRLVPWLLLGGWCGLRAAEIAGLEVEDFTVDIAGQAWVRVIGKGDVERVVPVPEWAWRRITPMLPPAGPCWRRERGSGPVTAKHVSDLHGPGGPPMDG